MRYDLFPLPKKGDVKKYYLDERLIESLPAWENIHHAYYNPYKVSTFVDIEDNQPLDTAEGIFLTPQGKVEYIN